MSRAIIQVLVQGRVQGVGYRAWVEYQAQASGLEGWVRNRRDGTVEALARGPQAAVDELIRWCRQGPPLARVTGVSVEAPPPDAPAADGFQRLPSA